MHIHPDISQSLARQKQQELAAAAHRHSLVALARRGEQEARSTPGRRRGVDAGRDITIRLATPEDARALADLSSLDSAAPLQGEVLVAEVEGRLWAACSLHDGRTIGDPFRLSHGARALLDLRRQQIAAAQLGVARLRRPTLRWLRQLRLGG